MNDASDDPPPSPAHIGIRLCKCILTLEISNSFLNKLNALTQILLLLIFFPEDVKIKSFDFLFQEYQLVT